MLRSLLASLATAAAALLAPVAPAHADIWKKAIEGTAGDIYEELLTRGDAYALAADVEGVTPRAVTFTVEKAIAAYTDAAAARPTEGEPYYRIAAVLETYFTECGGVFYPGFGRPPPATCLLAGRRIDPARAKQVLDAWDAFEARAPLDPRLREARFNRAVLRTKLVQGAKDPVPLLERAIEDYVAIVDRSDGIARTFTQDETTWGNLAESYMMVGKLDPAIEAYRVAMRGGGDTSIAYGLAVALDRDGSPAEALEVIRKQGAEAFRRYQRRFQDGEIFYVPQGEEHYYIALILEAFDRPVEALAAWNAFIQSGAHPRYQPRAKQHRDALMATLKTRPPAPRRFDPFDLD